MKHQSGLILTTTGITGFKEDTDTTAQLPHFGSRTDLRYVSDGSAANSTHSTTASPVFDTLCLTPYGARIVDIAVCMSCSYKAILYGNLERPHGPQIQVLQN
jgi:hypothetical protein